MEWVELYCNRKYVIIQNLQVYIPTEKLNMNQIAKQDIISEEIKKLSVLLG